MNKSIADYQIIRSINFETDFSSENYECSLRLSLCKSGLQPKNSIEILFSGISNLKIQNIGGGISQIVRLDIEDISRNQWDRINFYVFDYETENISFYCKNFKFVTSEP